MAYRWFVMIQNKAEAAVQKYISRGYQFKTAEETESKLRSAQDKDACFLTFGELDTARTQHLQGLRWSQKGANINAQDGRYDNALQAALEEGHLEIAEMLIQKGVDVNAQGVLRLLQRKGI